MRERVSVLRAAQITAMRPVDYLTRRSYHTVMISTGTRTGQA